MDPQTGETVPAAVLRAELSGGDAAARERTLTALCRAHAAGLDCSAVIGARCLRGSCVLERVCCV